MTLTELVSALQAQEQRKAIRKNEETGGAFQAKEKAQTQSSGKGKKQFWNKNRKEDENSNDGGKKRENFPMSTL